MEFDQEPDYEYIENMLESIKEKNKLADTFDWGNNSGKKEDKSVLVEKDKDQNLENISD